MTEPAPVVRFAPSPSGLLRVRNVAKLLPLIGRAEAEARLKAMTA